MDAGIEISKIETHKVNLSLSLSLSFSLSPSLRRFLINDTAKATREQKMSLNCGAICTGMR